MTATAMASHPANNVVYVDFANRTATPTPTTRTAPNAGMSTTTYSIKDPTMVQEIQHWLLTKSATSPQLCARNYLWFTLGINLGFRVSDLVHLQWKHIFYPGTGDFRDDPGNVLDEQKTSKRRLVILNDSVKAAVTYYLQVTGQAPGALLADGYVFASHKTKTLPVQPDAVRKLLKAAGAAVGVPFTTTTHAMRKTFGYNYYQACDRDLGETQAVLNHSDSRHTLRYIGIDEDQHRATYNKLPSTWVPTV